MKLHYEIVGSGKAFVWLHGNLDSGDNFRHLASLIPGKHYLVDSRNHGKSPNSKDFSYQAYSDDIERFFVDSALKQATLVGYSKGGRDALSFVTKRPELVERLVILEAVPANYFTWNNEFNIKM